MAFNPGAGGGISSASDVSFDTLQDDQVLTYDSDSAKWQNQNSNGAATDQLINFSQSGVLSTGTGQGRFVFPMAVSIQDVTATVGTAPAGSAVTLDLNRNGSTIFSTQANRPSIAAGSTVSSAATPNTTAISAGQYLTVDIDQVGSSTAGSDLTVVIRYQVV